MTADLQERVRALEQKTRKSLDMNEAGAVPPWDVRLSTDEALALSQQLAACQQERDRLKDIDVQFTKAMTQAARQVRSLEKTVAELQDRQSRPSRP